MSRYDSTNIEIAKILPVVKELVDRCGSPEIAAEYSGVGRTTIYRIIYKEHKTMQARTARLFILALYEKRKEDRRNGASKRFIEAKRFQAMSEEQIRRTEGY